MLYNALLSKNICLNLIQILKSLEILTLVNISVLLKTFQFYEENVQNIVTLYL